VLLLFFFTGIAIAVYLNMAAIQPRERDYAFAGSTYAFAIWIGLGVLMVQQWLQRIVKPRPAVLVSLLLCLLAAPVLMARAEWDDHDRSKKSLARASAWNTLQSCAPNAILFTVGDNDTYPLWYLQEVEGVRRDVRVIITELLGTDWYIDQLNYRINDADAVPMVWKKADYIGGRHNYVQYYKNPQVPQDKYLNLYDVCRFITSSEPQNQMRLTSGEPENYLPAKKFFVPSLSKDALVKAGLLPAADTTFVTNEMKFDFPKDAAYKNDLAVMNIVAAVAQQGWKRPVYFNGSFPGSENYDGLGDYMRMEGVVFCLVPWRYNQGIQTQEHGSVHLDKSYDLLMNRYLWGGGERTDVYFDEKNRVMFTAYRLNAARLADALTAAGRKQDAVRVLDKIMGSITSTSFPYDFSAYYIALAYYHAGAPDKARSLSQQLVKNATDDINWIAGLDEAQQEGEAGGARNDLGMINMLMVAAQQAGDSTTATAYNATLQSAYGKVAPLVNVQQQSQ
jgi:tetratricopeptide (TPR) repeat protein